MEKIEFKLGVNSTIEFDPVGRCGRCEAYAVTVYIPRIGTNKIFRTIFNGRKKDIDIELAKAYFLIYKNQFGI